MGIAANHHTKVDPLIAPLEGRSVHAAASKTILTESVVLLLPGSPPPQRTSRRPAPTTINSVTATPQSAKFCEVELDGVCLSLLVDTGASRSLINAATVKRLFPHRTLTASTEELYSYGHSKIQMEDTISFTVRYGDKTLPSFTFQVSHQGTNLMGFDLFCESGLAPCQLARLGSRIGRLCSVAWAASPPLTISLSSDLMCNQQSSPSAACPLLSALK